MLTDNHLRDLFCKTNTSEPLSEGWPGLERFARAVEKAARCELVETAIYKNKAPLLITPEKLWKENRVFDLIDVLHRKHQEREDIHEEWLDELRREWLDELRSLLHDILHK